MKKKSGHDLSKFPKENKFYPKEENIFSCFNYFNIQETKVVILAQDPYHTEDQATGLAFECGVSGKEQPSLKNIKKLLGTDKIDFKEWAKKGILLLNCSLTVEEGKAGSHMKFWLPFTKFIIDYISKNVSNVIFICWGLFSKEICKNIPEKQKIISSHPSPLSANKKLGTFPSFFESKVFDILKEKIDLSLKIIEN